MQPGASLALLTPHNEHWSTIPILLNLPLYMAFGIRTYVPYMAVTLVAHLLVAHLVWRWTRRLGAYPWLATGLAAVFVVLGAGAENIAWSFQIGFVLPVALGLLGALVIDRDALSLARIAAYWPIGVAATMCSGIGVDMVALGGVLVLLRRGWREALTVIAVPALVYIAWVVGFAHANVSTTPAPKWELTLIPLYIWNGISTAMNATLALPGAGGIVFIGLGVWLYMNRALARTSAAFAFAGPIAAIILFAILGIGRIALGVSESGSTRYGYIFDALVVPALALAVARLAKHAQPARLLAVAGTAVLAVNGIAGLETYVSSNGPLQTAERGEIVAAAKLISSNAALAVGGDGEVEPVRSPDLTVAVLTSMVRQSKVDLGDATTAVDALNASVYLQTGETPVPLVTSGGTPSLGADVRPAPSPAGAGCYSVSNGAASVTLRLVFDTPGSVAITPGGSGDLAVQQATADAPLVLSARNLLPVTAGSRIYFNDTATRSAPLLTLPAGVTLVCGVSG